MMDPSTFFSSSFFLFVSLHFPFLFGLTGLLMTHTSAHSHFCLSGISAFGLLVAVGLALDLRSSNPLFIRLFEAGLLQDTQLSFISLIYVV